MRAQQCYSVGIYCRLSRDDNSGAESMSIANQRDLLTAYAEERRWNIHGVYIDDGVSGTTFEREGFQRMISDIENGKINCVVTKDLSRLGRNYVQVGQYTDFFFPRMGVRYIAIMDDYDSLKSDNDIAPFRNVLNEMYAKDTSRKVRSARMTKARQRKFMGSQAPYGHVKSSADKHLLKNQVYIGHMVQGKREVVSFKTKERQFRDREDWIIVENTHDPLIDFEIWQKV